MQSSAFPTRLLTCREALAFVPSTPTTTHNPSSLRALNILSRILDQTGRAGGFPYALRDSPAYHVSCRGSVLLHLGPDPEADWATRRSQLCSAGVPLPVLVLLGESVRMVAPYTEALRFGLRCRRPS